MLKNYKKLMVIAPHPDDEILGCGGLIAKFSKIKNTEISIVIVSGHLPPLYKQKEFDITKKECLRSLETISKKINIYFLELPATYLKDLPISQINSLLNEKIKKFNPEILCIPFPDRHTDHRIIFDSSLVVARPNSKFFPKVLLSYETLSETHWNAPYIEPNFTPDLYINIDKEIEIKCRALNCYKSQIKNNSSRSIKAVKALAAFRGSQNACNFAEGYKVLRILT